MEVNINGVKKYVFHTPDCASHKKLKCDCGFDEALAKFEKSELTRINDISFIETLAKLTKCLPSYFVGGNEHIIKAIQSQSQKLAEIRKLISRLGGMPNISQMILEIINKE